MGSLQIISELPERHTSISFSGIDELTSLIKSISKEIEKHNGLVNPWIVIHGLPSSVLLRLYEGRLLGTLLRVKYFDDESLGVIKVLPDAVTPETMILSKFRDEITDSLHAMGVPGDEFMWSKGVERPDPSHPEKDNAWFFPGDGKSAKYAKARWPTLAMQVGFDNSMDKLRGTARDCLVESMGKVRIVILLGLHKQAQFVALEKWQLAPADSPQPLTPDDIHRLQSQLPCPLPPTEPQPVAAMQPFCQTEMLISRDRVRGDGFFLPFSALFGREANEEEGEGNIHFFPGLLKEMVRGIWPLKRGLIGPQDSILEG